MESKKLKFVNAKQEEAEALYREVFQGFSDFKKHVWDFKKGFADSEEEIETIEKVLGIIEDVEDEGIVKFKKAYLKEIEKAKDAITQAQVYQERLDHSLVRAENFMELFKEEFIIDEETQETTLGFGALLLLEYLHTINKVVQQEEEPKTQ